MPRLLRLLLVALVAATVLLHFRSDEPSPRSAIDPYRRADSILAARGFTADASTPSWGLATRVVSYSSEECPRGVTLAELSYDQLRIVLERTSAVSATPYLVVGPSWESSDLGRFDLFFAALACKVREPMGPAVDECGRYLYLAHTPGCLRREDWRGFWRVR